MCSKNSMVIASTFFGLNRVKSKQKFVLTSRAYNMFWLCELNDEKETNIKITEKSSYKIEEIKK